MPLNPTREPRVYALIGCTPLCGLSADKLGPENARIVHSWFELPLSVPKVILRAQEELGVKLTGGGASRHFKNHLRLQEETRAVDPNRKGGTASDLEVLEGVIEAAWRNSGSWRPTIQDALKAMDMKYKLTQGSVFEDFFAAISDAQMDEDDGETQAPENPEAVSDLVEDPLGDSLPEPFSGDPE